MPFGKLRTLYNLHWHSRGQAASEQLARLGRIIERLKEFPAIADGPNEVKGACERKLPPVAKA